MTNVTDQFELCFCFVLHSQHNWYLCRQLATYALSCLCILVCKSAWRHGCRCLCNWTKTIEEHIIVFYTWYLRNCTWCQQSSYLCSNAWVSEGFFPWGPLADCSTGNHKNFSRGSESDEISFFLIETKKMTFFAKNAIDKFQTSKSRGKAPLPTPIILGEFTVVLYDCYGCTRHRDVASVGEWCPAPHLKSVPPISCLDPRLLHISNIVFKNVPPCGFCPPPAAKSWRRAWLDSTNVNATAERSFSCLRRLKNYLTNKLNQEHLNHRMFLHIHKHLIDQVDLIAILQEFIAENDCRIKLFWKEFCTVAP